jgi:hypothetical protein
MAFLVAFPVFAVMMSSCHHGVFIILIFWLRQKWQGFYSNFPCFRVCVVCAQYFASTKFSARKFLIRSWSTRSSLTTFSRGDLYRTIYVYMIRQVPRFGTTCVSPIHRHVKTWELSALKEIRLTVRWSRCLLLFSATEPREGWVGQCYAVKRFFFVISFIGRGTGKGVFRKEIKRQ